MTLEAEGGRVDQGRGVIQQTGQFGPAKGLDPVAEREGDDFGPGPRAIDQPDLGRPGQQKGRRRAPRRAAGAQDHHWTGGRVKARRLGLESAEQAYAVSIVGQDRAILGK